MSVAGALIEAPRRPSQRGYDTAGISNLDRGWLSRRQAHGNLSNIQKKLDQSPLSSAIGFDHTRWATHGRSNETNAHPDATGWLAAILNGISENFAC